MLATDARRKGGGRAGNIRKNELLHFSIVVFRTNRWLLNKDQILSACLETNENHTALRLCAVDKGERQSVLRTAKANLVAVLTVLEVERHPLLILCSCGGSVPTSTTQCENGLWRNALSSLESLPQGTFKPSLA